MPKWNIPNKLAILKIPCRNEILDPDETEGIKHRNIWMIKACKTLERMDEDTRPWMWVVKRKFDGVR